MEHVQRFSTDIYKVETINGEIIVSLKQKYISDKELNKINLAKSHILNCIIKNKNSNTIITKHTKYFSILKEIWHTMSPTRVVKTSDFKIEIGDKKCVKGYIFDKNLGLSIQRKDANQTMKEIINMLRVNNYSIDIKIQLNGGKVINYKYN